MALRFENRLYGGKTFRPRPEIHFDANAGLLIVATPWGPREPAKKSIERMLDYLALSDQDGEATNPFGRLTGFSPTSNRLRAAVMLANDSILRDDNKSEYRAGIELFAASFAEREFAWAQAGAPQPILLRHGHSTLPLGPQFDLSFDLSEGEGALPALPNNLLGLDSSANLYLGGFRARPGDRVLLLSCSSPPDSLNALSSENIELERISSTLSQASPDQAFWIGLLELQK